MYPNKCAQPACDSQSRFKFLGAKERYCGAHRPEGATLYLPACGWPGCEELLSAPRQFCNKHVGPARRTVCEVDDCNRRGYYALEGQPVSRCHLHRLEGMSVVKLRATRTKSATDSQCKRKGCAKQAVYGAVGQSPQYCAAHKHKGMIDHNAEPCDHEGCLTMSVTRFCAAHKPDTEGCQETVPKSGICKRMACDMPTPPDKQLCDEHYSDVKFNRSVCVGEDCVARGVYKTEDSPLAYCSKHRPEGSYNFNNACKYEGCTVTRSYGLVGGKRMYCVAHKTEGMVAFQYVCAHKGCKEPRRYGHPDEAPQFCSAHKEEGMVVLKKRTCEQPGCEVPVSYGYPDGTTVRCVEHQLDGMVYTRRL